MIVLYTISKTLTSGTAATAGVVTSFCAAAFSSNLSAFRKTAGGFRSDLRREAAEEGMKAGEGAVVVSTAGARVSAGVEIVVRAGAVHREGLLTVVVVAALEAGSEGEAVDVQVAVVVGTGGTGLLFGTRGVGC